MASMQLTAEEQEMLDGRQGEAMAKAAHCPSSNSASIPVRWIKMFRRT